MLHTVNKSPFSHNTLDECATFAVEGAPILLLEDGVYAAKAGTRYETKLKEILTNHKVYVIKADVEARGIGALTDGVKQIGYDGFVELTENHITQTWV